MTRKHIKGEEHLTHTGIFQKKLRQESGDHVHEKGKPVVIVPRVSFMQTMFGLFFLCAVVGMYVVPEMHSLSDKERFWGTIYLGLPGLWFALHCFHRPAFYASPEKLIVVRRYFGLNIKTTYSVSPSDLELEYYSDVNGFAEYTISCQGKQLPMFGPYERMNEYLEKMQAAVATKE